MIGHFHSRPANERHKRSQDDAAPYGCFSYHYESEARTIRFHFGNRDGSGPGPLSRELDLVQRQELAAMFADVRRQVPEAEAVHGWSWLYNLPSYRRLFPPAYVETAVPVQPELQFMSMWGQFLDRYWDLRPGPASLFLHRLGTARTAEALVESFPLPVLAPRCASITSMRSTRSFDEPVPVWATSRAALMKGRTAAGTPWWDDLLSGAFTERGIGTACAIGGSKLDFIHLVRTEKAE